MIDLVIQDLIEQDPRVPDDESPRLEDDVVVLPFLFQKLAVFLQVGLFFVLVGDANASSQIKVTDLKVVSPQIGRDYLKLQESLHKRFYIQNLRADMEAYSNQPEVI